jgi:ribonucleotide reductase beta subunit family protein with ferritin-like domain
MIDELVNHNSTEIDHLLSTAIFSMLEGAVLYSAFAFLKHFQSQGKNKLLNVVRGINFSAIDENLHAIGGAMLFQAHLKEADLSSAELDKLNQTITKYAQIILEHEELIIDKIFEKGEISGISKDDLKTFVKSRLNICSENLGLEKLFNINTNPISEWFYNGINNYQFLDFFSGMGREYQRDWDETKFIWGNTNV